MLKLHTTLKAVLENGTAFFRDVAEAHCDRPVLIDKEPGLRRLRHMH